jgi:hypothetical protein
MAFNAINLTLKATQLFFCKIEQALIFLSGEELHAHHRTG